MNTNRRGIIICGTDTDVGKTVVSSLLVQGLNGIYWKPIQSGLEGGGDTNRVRKILNLPNERWIPEAYAFQAAVSPHWAAEKENKQIDPKNLKKPITKGSPLIIETAGGLMVPLNRKFLQIEQIKTWGLPVILVARSTLGTLNHTLLSLEALKNRDIDILGIIINGVPHKDNPQTLEQFGNVPIIAHLHPLQKLSPQTLQEQWEKQNIENTLKNLINK